MTIPLLENPLVVKYFSSERKAYYPCNDPVSKMDAAAWDKCAMAYRILQAMSEPIKKGEKFLENDNNGGWDERVTALSEFAERGFHPFFLRLPDQFQRRCGHNTYPNNYCSCPENQPDQPKRECGYDYQCQHENHRFKLPCPDCHKKPDPVEEKIEELVEFFGAKGARNANEAIRKVFRELVGLARKEKPNG